MTIKQRRRKKLKAQSKAYRKSDGYQSKLKKAKSEAVEK